MNINSSTIDKYLESLKNAQLIKENDVKTICANVREILIEEGNVQRIDAPVTVVGDIHGQFYDLQEIFEQFGECPDVNYLFLGNYVNRGHHSIETILLLYALKIKYPDRITLLRGNHESRIVTQVFGLYDECLRKYGSLNVWRYITETFEYLTISALIEDKIFCVHGGLAEEQKSLDDIRMLDRIGEIPVSGSLCELLWNDPEEDLQQGFKLNPRGCGKVFGQDVAKQFLEQNNVTKILRSHSLFLEGHKQIWDKSVSTIFSAPNYCYRCGNVGSIVQINENLDFEFKSYQASKDQLKNATQKVQNAVPDYFL
ncbi:hypothetical protein PPERSA_08969 [Pseudocohnilembus persalinus]|uniref:Serine/threonine-protein phosphatase n=1 Tax=Pseudocohnilembus persalinus TaxID=266149 RepID=A0A0V0R300_PSEPJ|nr:hypothetical protein PPERSA_08969 [Pseudocohnilembus persalinus]|eukprot:KRX08865.1 hypothetical protein PPERSA_08969 [Pseudocohnilembus persalinus]